MAVVGCRQPAITPRLGGSWSRPGQAMRLTTPGAPSAASGRLLPRQILRRLGLYRIQVSVRASSPQEGPDHPSQQRKTESLAAATARLLLTLPVAAAFLGLTPRPADAASRAAGPTATAVIDSTSGMPQRWVYSEGRWGQDEYSSIYRYYTQPQPQAQVPAMAQQRQKRQERAAAPPKAKAVETAPKAAAVAPSKVDAPVKQEKQQKKVEVKAEVKPVPAPAPAPAPTKSKAPAAAAPAPQAAKASETPAFVKSVDSFRAAVGDSVLSQVRALRAAATAAMPKATPQAPAPAKQQQEKPQAKAKVAAPVKQQEKASQAKATKTAAAPAKKAAAKAVPAATEAPKSVDLLARADAFRQRLGQAVMSQAAAFKQAATAALPSPASKPAAAPAPAAKGAAKPAVKSSATPAKAKAAPAPAKTNRKAKPGAAAKAEAQQQPQFDLLAKAEAFRQSLGNAVLSQAAAFKEAAAGVLPARPAAAPAPAATAKSKAKAAPKLPAKPAKAVERKATPAAAAPAASKKQKQQKAQPPAAPARASLAKELAAVRDAFAAALAWRPTLVSPASSGSAAPAAAAAAPAWGWAPTVVVPSNGAATSPSSSAPAWGWAPTTVVPLSGSSASTAAWGWAPTVFGPPRVALLAFGILASAYLLGVAWRRATALAGEAVEGLDTSIIPAAPGDASNDNADGGEDAEVWAAGRRPDDAEFAAVAGGPRAWEPTPVAVGDGPTREELIAESERRIAAAKEAVARAEAERAAAAEAAAEAERRAAEREAAAAAAQEKVAAIQRAASNETAGTSSASSRGSIPSVTATSAAAAAAAAAAKGRSQAEIDAEQAARAARARASREHNPVSAFVSALDSRSHTTPLVALLGLASAAVSGAVDAFNGTASSSSSSKKGAEWTVTDALLAPAAPLLAALPESPVAPASGGAAKDPIRYDAVLDVLRAALASPVGASNSDKYSPVSELLAAAPPRPGAARYDFVRSVVRGLADAQTAPAPAQPYDAVRQLLRDAAAAEDPVSRAAADRFCVVHDLLHAAALVDDWGPPASRYDPLQGQVGRLAASDWNLSDWAGPSRFCPVTDIINNVQPAAPGAASKYDPFSAVAKDDSNGGVWAGPARNRARTPLREERYDPLAGAFSAILTSQPPVSAGKDERWDPVAIALDAAAGWRPNPAGGDRYDLTAAALGALASVQPPRAGDGGDRWDPVRWVLAGWAAEWEGPAGAVGAPVSPTYDPVAGIRHAQAPTTKSKYDLAQAVLNAEPPTLPFVGSDGAQAWATEAVEAAAATWRDGLPRLSGALGGWARGSSDAGNGSIGAADKPQATPAGSGSADN